MIRAKLLETKRTAAGPLALIQFMGGRRVAVAIDRHATHIPEIVALPGVDQVRVAALEALGAEWRAPTELELGTIS